MIFKQWQQVLDGTKTQTRRPVKDDEKLIGGDVGKSMWVHSGAHNAAMQQIIAPRARFVTGKTYAVQPGRGKKAVGRIRVTKIRRQRLGEISEEDCMHEGVGIDYAEPLDDVLRAMAIKDPVFVCPICGATDYGQLSGFSCLWEHIYGKGAWDRMKDDDVWALDFELEEKGR